MNDAFQRPSSSLRQRVIDAAETVLKTEGHVGPLELFQAMRFLNPTHVNHWQRGHEQYSCIEPWIQCGPEKFARTLEYFEQWTKERGLRPVEAAYRCAGMHGLEELFVSKEGSPEREKFYRTHYAPSDLPKAKVKRLIDKLEKAPDIVVFQTVNDSARCADCGIAFEFGDFMRMEKGQPLCLVCADLDHLVFLPAGNGTLSRRARKNSPLSAVVMRHNRSRDRYERQGLLVGVEALDKAEEECAADAPERAVQRERAALKREEEDRDLVDAMVKVIKERYPGCPTNEAWRIACHTGLRGSGRVGRSAAGRNLDQRAMDLAVVAHIRHEHTDYDTLLMRGTDRSDARQLIGEKIQEVLSKWSAA